MARMLVVVAHPDDESFGCGSLLAHAAARGVATAVCCATRGESGEPAPGSGVHPEQLAAAREVELHAAAKVLGVERVELLDYLDSGITGDPPAGALVAADRADVARRVAGVIDDVRPDVVVTLDGSDGHRDHHAIRDATLAAVDLAAHDVARVYLWCLPRRLMARWAEHLRAADPVSEYLEFGRLGTPDEEITTVVDVAAHIEVRQRAIAAHASQVSPYEGLPADLVHDFLATDHLIRVRPPWQGGEPESDVFGAP